MEPSDDGSSTSTSSCVSETQETHEDAQILCLLDAMDRLLSCRDSLARLLSQGWMEIASARYSMGPSRIDQALFSLKPCPASMLVTFSTSHNASKDEGQIIEDEEVYNSNQEYQFSLRQSDASISSQTLSSKADALPKPQLRQRHSSGMQHTGSNYLEDGEVADRECDLTQDVHESKRSDSLAWFGALVSPHLRSAKSTFKDALEIVVEMATVQSTIVTAYQQIKDIDGHHCEDV